MSDQPTRPTRPELGQPRTKPRPAAVTGDPADPITTAPTAPASDTAPSSLPASKPSRRMVPISTAEPTIAVQYRLTDRERDILLRMQEARGDRRGIDTMRWFLATYGEQAIATASADQ